MLSESRNVKVCNKCFLATFGETPSFLRTIINKEFKDNEEGKYKDSRGRHEPKNKLSEDKKLEILNHISKFPAYESHYSRSHTSRKYLSSALNTCIMYKLYKKETFKPVSLTTYRTIFKTTKLKFKPPKLDTCHKCDVFDAMIEYRTDETAKSKVIQLKDEHLEEAQNAYDQKTIDKKKSLDNKNLHMILGTFDLQQCLPTSVLSTSVSFYKRPFWTYNLTIRNSTMKSTSCFMWHQAIAERGTCGIGSCLNRFIRPSAAYRTRHLIF